MVTDEQAWAAVPPRGWVRQYVEYASRATDAPVAFHLGTAWAVMSQISPLDYGIRWFGSYMYTPTWVVLVGDSADVRKSSSLEIGTQMLREVMEGRTGTMAGTREGLLDQLAMHPQQLLVVPEFGDFLSSTRAGRYGEAIKGLLINAWDGKDTRQPFAGGKIRGHASPRLSLIGGCALPFLEAFAGREDFTSGYFNRFIWLLAPQTQYKALPDDFELETQRSEVVESLAYLLSHEQAGQCVGFTPGARELWRSWAEELRGRRRKLDLVSSTLTGRVESNALRLSLLYSLDVELGEALRYETWELDEAALSAGIAGAELGYLSAVRLVDSLAPNEQIRQERQVLYGLSEEDWRPASEVYRTAKLQSQTGAKILESLKAKGLAESTSGPGGSAYWRAVSVEVAQSREEVGKATLSMARGAQAIGPVPQAQAQDYPDAVELRDDPYPEA